MKTEQFEFEAKCPFYESATKCDYYPEFCPPMNMAYTRECEKVNPGADDSSSYAKLAKQCDSFRRKCELAFKSKKEMMKLLWKFYEMSSEFGIIPFDKFVERETNNCSNEEVIGKLHALEDKYKTF